MTKRLKHLIGQLIFSSHMHHPLLANAAVVVTFHRVNNTLVADGLTCSVEMFDTYCRFFADYFHVVSLPDLVRRMNAGLPLDRRLAITFDDGYRDNYENAAPLLKAMALPATFFVVSHFIDTQYVPWWDSALSVPQPWMTWDQVRSLYREGFEIGAHTRTHADLGEISREEARNEILGSRLDLEENLSAPVDLFAYPYGEENRMTEVNRGIVKAAGFSCCCSCFGGMNDKETDPFHLRRVPISSWYASAHQLGCEVALRRA